MYFPPFCHSLAHALLSSVYIYSHSTVSFSLLYPISFFSRLVTQLFRQTCQAGSSSSQATAPPQSTDNKSHFELFLQRTYNLQVATTRYQFI